MSKLLSEADGDTIWNDPMGDETTTQPNDWLDKLFNQAINAKQVAVETTQEITEYLEQSELVVPANELLDRFRTEFKAAIQAKIAAAEKAAMLRQRAYDERELIISADITGRIDEIKQREKRLESLLKKNYELGTGDLSGFNTGINAVLNNDRDRIAELQKRLAAQKGRAE